jgi:magnesium transporter
VIAGIAIYIWFRDVHLSLLIAVAMTINMTAAGFFGIVVPIALNKLKIDPAISSSVFVTTVTDVFGFLSFLGLASYFLKF